MGVTKIKLLANQALFDKVWFKDTIFYITNPYRHSSNTTIEMSDVFNLDGDLLGRIQGYYFDFGGGKVFERCKEDD